MNKYKYPGLAALALLTLCTPTTAPAAVQVTELLQEYNVITLGNFNANFEVEGKVLVGGNLHVSKAIQFGFNSGIPQGEYSLAVQGTVTGSGPIQVNEGSVLTYNSTSTPFNMNSGGSVDTGLTAWAGLEGSLGGSMDDVATGLRNYSSFLSTLQADGQFDGSDANHVKLRASGATVSVLTISASALNNARGLETQLNGSSLLVVNVTGTSANITGNWLGSSTANNGRVLFNFVNAQDITIDLERQFQGTLLAPTATVTANGGFQGGMFVDNLENGDEGHFRPIQGPLPLIPEPGAELLLLIGGVLFILRRRR